MKNMFLVPVLVIVLSAVIFGGCAAPVSSPAPSSAPAPAPTPAPTLKPTPAPTTTPTPAPAPAATAPPTPAPTPSPAPTPTAKTEPPPPPAPTPAPAGKYSAAECKVLTAEDIASVLGVTAKEVEEQPVQKQEALCMESWIIKKGGMPSGSIVVTLIETKAHPLYKNDPAICLKNMCGSNPSLGIGDGPSCNFMGAVSFSKGKYLISVVCPMGCSDENKIALAKLIDKHI